MMDHKTIIKRGAKANVRMMIAEITDDRKKELIEKYKREKTTIGKNPQRILIGNWFNNAVTMMLKGATEEELNRVVEHLVVLLGAEKYHLDVKQSYKDHDLLALSRKYFTRYKKVEKENGEVIYVKESVMEKRKRMHEEFEKMREELKEEALKMKAKGMTNEQIAVLMNFPEVTIRNLLKESE